MGPFSNSFIALGSLLISSNAWSQGMVADKVAALDNPVCTLPYGQTIEVPDLPKKDLAMNWMSRLKSNLPISLVSIPATHDAGTALGRTGWTRCQVLTIPAQLALGIRGFDIRLRNVRDELGIYHSEESQHLTFETVMDSFRQFLRDHPKEFLVMRVREEAKAIAPIRSFEEAVGSFFNSPKYAHLIYRAKSRSEIPIVGDVRGKIVILDNYGKLPEAIDYPSSTMSVQDDYDISDMDKKYKEIESKFQDALSQKSGAVWNVNYTSSSTLAVDQLANAKAVNPVVEAFLAHRKGHLGLVLMNFPGAKEIRWIWESNFR